MEGDAGKLCSFPNWRPAMKIYVSVLALSTFFFSLELLIFPLLRSFFRDFSSAFHKSYVFLLCNGILAFIVVNSGVSGSYSEQVVKTENERRGRGERELAVETREVEDVDGDEEERWTENEDGKKQLEIAEEEEEERGEMASAEELHRKCDDFIRRVREAMRYELSNLPLLIDDH